MTGITEIDVVVLVDNGNILEENPMAFKNFFGFEFTEDEVAAEFNLDSFANIDSDDTNPDGFISYYRIDTVLVFYVFEEELEWLLDFIYGVIATIIIERKLK